MPKKKKVQKENRASGTKLRIWIVAAVFATVAFGGLVWRLAILQLRDYEFYRSKAAMQQLSDDILVPNRGVIYDSDMKVLAKSSTVWTVTLAPNEVKEDDIAKVADILSEVLEVDRAGVVEKLKNRTSQYAFVKKKVEMGVAQTLRDRLSAEKVEDGVYLEQDSKRYYPYGDFAPYIIGFCGSDNQGLGGVENYYDDVLTGTPGRVLTAKNGWGRNMPYDYATRFPSEDGNSLVLTINQTLQHYAEKHLELAVKAHNATERGVCILMDPDTGAILAWAQSPGFDLNDPYTIADEAAAAAIEAMPESTEEEQKAKNDAMWEARYKQWRNKGVSDLYEPGSVFKIVTASAALDSGSATLNSGYYCPGYQVVSGVRISCAHTEGHGSQTFAQALMNSCNPAFIQMSANMGEDLFFDYFNAYGLTEPTGVDLPGEATSQYYTPEKMGPVELASCSFGQSNKITCIQMITAVCTAVNGGHLVQPHVVSQILDPSGNIVENIDPPARRQVINEEVSKEINEIMEKFVSTGGGVGARVIGYKIGGKSGTAEKLDDSRAHTDDKVYIASFVGVAPSDDPKVVCLVILDEPHTFSIYGGQICAPVVKDVLRESLQYMGIEPVYTEEELAKIEDTVPWIKAGETTIFEAQKQLEDHGFQPQLVGEGNYAYRMFPASGTKLVRGSTVLIYTEDGMPEQMTTVPNVTGKTVSVAVQMLKAAGLNVKTNGVDSGNDTAYAVAQDMAGGVEVQVGTPVTITLRDDSIGADDYVENVPVTG